MGDMLMVGGLKVPLRRQLRNALRIRSIRRKEQNIFQKTDPPSKNGLFGRGVGANGVKCAATYFIIMHSQHIITRSKLDL